MLDFDKFKEKQNLNDFITFKFENKLLSFLDGVLQKYLSTAESYQSQSYHPFINC
jgi:hypothetical protein